MEFASSSSSSSSFLNSEPQFRYDVFINFWGEDIGRKLVSHLHSALLQAQVKTFIKEGNLQEGMELEEHMREIAASKIAIIVFSKSYTESTCCLLQLEKIIGCNEIFGQIVVPVFYEIDLLDVRKALEEAAHKRYSGERLKFPLSRRSYELNRPVGMSGLDVRDFRHDAELVERIVSRVQTLLDYKDLSITQFPVGLEWHVEKVIGCIENHSTRVCMIGIWGMGGSGKTTIAKAIYNRIYRSFIGKSFINLRQVCDQEYDCDLQENVPFDLLKSYLLNPNYKKISVAMRTIIQDELYRRKWLIVLDQVDKVREFGLLENLCERREWFGQGTVIIITARDIRLLNRLKVDYVYKMDDVMKKKEPRKPFNWHALWGSKTKKRLE